MKMLLLDHMLEREHKQTPQRANIQDLCVLVQTGFVFFVFYEIIQSKGSAFLIAVELVSWLITGITVGK